MVRRRKKLHLRGRSRRGKKPRPEPELSGDLLIRAWHRAMVREQGL